MAEHSWYFLNFNGELLRISWAYAAQRAVGIEITSSSGTDVGYVPRICVWSIVLPEDSSSQGVSPEISIVIFFELHRYAALSLYTME